MFILFGGLIAGFVLSAMMGRVMGGMLAGLCTGAVVALFFGLSFAVVLIGLMVFSSSEFVIAAVAAGQVAVAADHGSVVAVVLAGEAHQDHGSY